MNVRMHNLIESIISKCIDLLNSVAFISLPSSLRHILPKLVILHLI